MTLTQHLKSRYLDDAAQLASGTVPAGARRLAWFSLACWTLTLIAGRLTGYPEIIARVFGYKI
jgi:hypothetical protein